jgi:integrase
MRRGELLGATWRCLDLDGARLHVEQQLVATRGGCTLGPPKSSRSRRTVALDEETVRVLCEHREVQLAERAFAGPAYADRDLVFADELGGPINPNRLSGAFALHRRQAGLPAGTLHTLRHTHATHLLSNGVLGMWRPLASATTGRRCSTPTRISCRLRTSRRPSGSRS